MRGTIICLAASLFLIFACAEPPKKKPRVVRKNRLYRCTPAEVLQKNMLDLVNQARRAKAASVVCCSGLR